MAVLNTRDMLADVASGCIRLLVCLINEENERRVYVRGRASCVDSRGFLQRKVIVVRTG